MEFLNFFDKSLSLLLCSFLKKYLCYKHWDLFQIVEGSKFVVKVKFEKVISS